MQIERLWLRDFRSYPQADLAPGPALNLILGANGHGKTNLLEAIWVLTGARSPRVADQGQLVRIGCPEGAVGAQVRTGVTGSVRDMVLRLRASGGRREFFVNGKRLRRTLDALGMLPAVWLSPEEIDVVREGPPARRRFLDVALAQLDPGFREAAVRFARILAQRNRALQQVAAGSAELPVLESWDDQLVREAPLISLARRQLVEELAETARAIHERLSDDSRPLSLSYLPSPPTLTRPSRQDYEAALRERLLRLRRAELARGATLTGPHREDFRVILGDRDVRTLASRGQQRSAAIALFLALWHWIEARSGEPPVLLLDDVASELDAPRRRRLYDVIPARAQTFITATELELVRPPDGRPARVWRVSDGRLELVSGR